MGILSLVILLRKEIITKEEHSFLLIAACKNRETGKLRTGKPETGY